MARPGWSAGALPGVTSPCSPRGRGRAGTKRVVFRSRYVHLAVGYRGLRYLPDLQRFREETRDLSSVVNANEPHEQTYDRLKASPGTVLGRGGGIVASRVLQRLIDDRDQNGLQSRILHLFRTYATPRTGRASSWAGRAATAGHTRVSTSPSRSGAG